MADHTHPCVVRDCGQRVECAAGTITDRDADGVMRDLPGCYDDPAYALSVLCEDHAAWEMCCECGERVAPNQACPWCYYRTAAQADGAVTA